MMNLTIKQLKAKHQFPGEIDLEVSGDVIIGFGEMVNLDSLLLHAESYGFAIYLDLDFSCVELPPEHTAGYQIERHQVSFYGICPDCQEST